VTKRILNFIFTFIIAAVATAILCSTALAGKPAQLFPGGTYLNQSATSGLSCLGGAAGATGTTTFVITVPSAQSGPGATLHIDYTFDPDDPTLPSYSGGDNFRAFAPATGIQPIPVSIALSGDDGSSATVVNTTALGIDSTGTLLFDSSAADAWSCGTPPVATGGGGETGGATCDDYQPLLDAVAGFKELTKKATESQRECLRGHYRQARHKLDEFVREAGKARKYDQTQAGVWIQMALELRNSLPVTPHK
jgi:hypothetical protein